MSGAELPGMLGRHPVMLDLFHRVKRVAPADLAVLIVGETGTGKELVARALHAMGRRAERPFVPVNCAAIPESLAEAELFGAEAGAYTGAVKRRKGWLERVQGGTLFLDEVCGMSRTLQAKLLRALEERAFVRVGGEEVIEVDFRLVAAVSEHPSTLLSQDTMRRDFLHRLGSCRVCLPPLRERGGDAVLLAEHYLRAYNRRLTDDARAFVGTHDWPGNVRELRGVMETLGTVADSVEISLAQLLDELHQERAASEAEQLRSALDRHGWNVAAAARALGMGRTRVYELLRRHRLDRPGAVSA